MKRRVLTALVALLAVAAIVAFYRWKRGPTDVTPLFTNANGAAETNTPGVVIVDATPLPAAFESPGLVSRRFGPLRLYVSVAPEIALEKGAGAANLVAGNIGGKLSGEKLASVPIRVVLENDSYREVDARRDLSLDGEELFQVSVSRADSGVVFSESQKAEETVWEPAERKTFDLSWPPGDTPPGEYVVSVKLAFGDPGEVKIRTRLK